MDHAVLPVVENAAEFFRIEPALITAVIMVESSGRGFATRFEPHTDRYLLHVDKWARFCRTTPDTERIHQKTSWGLMQVMGFTARELEFRGHLPELCLPVAGIQVGCQYLKVLQNRYGKAGAILELDEEVVAAYNAGSPRRLETGAFVNDSYVRKVAKFYREYRTKH